MRDPESGVELADETDAPVADDADGATLDAPAPARKGGLLSLLAIVLVVGLALGGAYLLNRPKTAAGSGFETVAAPAGPPLKVGDTAPDFTATDLSGRTVKLSDMRGRGVWLTFGASWCTACRAEAPDIEAAYKARPANTEVVGIWMGEEPETVKAYTQKLGASYTQVPDPTQSVTNAYRVFGVPLHVFVGADGKIKAVHQGILAEETMKQELGRLV